MQVFDPKRCSFRCACSGVIHKQDQCVVAASKQVAPIRHSQQRIHLGLFQVAEFVPLEALERDGANRSTPRNLFRTMLGNKMGQSMNRCQPLVAGTNRALAFLFQMIREAGNTLFQNRSGISHISCLQV